MPESRPISKNALYIENLFNNRTYDNRPVNMPDPYENVPIIELTKHYDPTDEQWKEFLKDFLRDKGLLND